MKIVILTTDQVYSNQIIKQLINSFPKEIKIIVESTVIVPNRTKLKGVLWYLRSSGIYYVKMQVIKLLIYKTLSRLGSIFLSQNSKFYPYKQMAQMKDIKKINSSNINSNSTYQTVKRSNPDLVISIFFNQIIRKKIIDLAKIAIVNLHPAYLPNYKGVSPIFWQMVNDEKWGGVSLHYVDDGIDTGDIISRKRIKFKNSDTEDSFYWKSARIGTDLLIDYINNVEELSKLKKVKNSKGSYYSIPSKKAVTTFKGKGKSFFNLKEYLYSL